MLQSAWDGEVSWDVGLSVLKPGQPWANQDSWSLSPTEWCCVCSVLIPGHFNLRILNE